MTRSRWVSGLALVGLVGVAAWTRTDGFRRFAVGVLDRNSVAAIAAPATHLAPRDRPPGDPDAGRPQVLVGLDPVLTGVVRPTDLAWIPGHGDRLVVLSKDGTAYLARPGQAPTPWFTLEVPTTSELGLLGIAFHPAFATNGTFYVDATPAVGPTGASTRILRGKVDPVTLAGPEVSEVVLEVAQPYPNHNGGQIAFGPDGMLYVALGDGGFRDDPKGNGQDLGTLLGAMLRIDVDHGRPYAVPPDNPFVGRPGARGEIWAYGLRNPWRFTFDPLGRMIAGDVGQNSFEEIDWIERGDNLGWKIREADHCFEPARGCPTAGLVDPIWSYPREEGVSVTGGVVWTGPGPLSGQYLFGDFGSGRLWALSLPATRVRVPTVTALGRFAIQPSAFARAPDGSVWVADFGGGAVYAVTPASP